MTTYFVTSLPSSVPQGESPYTYERNCFIKLPDPLLPLGDTNLVLSSQSDLGVTRETSLLAAIRLRPGEEGSALWQMRCSDAELKAVLKSTFDDN